MKIRKRTAMLFAATFILVVAVVFIASHTILLDRFVRLDEEAVYDDVQRLNSALEDEIYELNAVSVDWASWDDSYEFIIDRNEDYIDSNLVDDVFPNLGINLMVYVNSQGEVVYSKAYDLRDEAEVALPAGFQQHLSAADAPLLSHPDTSSTLEGILLLPEGPMLVASNPILTSASEGPIRGTLIWGRYLDDEVIAALAAQTLLSLDIIPFDDGESLSNFEEAQYPLLEGSIFVSPLDKESISGYSLMRDIYGEPAIILSVDAPRTIYQQGLTTVYYFLLFVALVTLIFGTLAYLVIDRLILSRIAGLSAKVDDLGRKRGFSAHLNLPGNDELTDLAKAMNTAFGELATYHRALADSEQKYSTLVEKSTDGILVLQDGLIRFANQKFTEMTGFSAEEVTGKLFLDLISPEHRKLAAEGGKRRQSGKKDPGIHEVEALTKDGGKIVIEVNTSAIQYEGKKADMVIIRDITERRKIQQQLVITDRLASVGELASGIAHEMNNPLTGVIGFAQLLLDKDIPDEVRENVDMVYREAQRAAQVVRNLLTFARKHPPEKQMLNINNVIEEVLELRAYTQRVNNIEIKAKLADDLPEVMADYFQLQQVFINIIINAEFFMKEAHNSGTLTITTESVDNRVRAAFADDGPGIAKGSLGHLFDPFFTTKEVGKGTGLGLSICHGIVAEHGGRIYAESKRGKGATFTVELPVGPPAEEIADPGESGG